MMNCSKFDPSTQFVLIPPDSFTPSPPSGPSGGARAASTSPCTALRGWPPSPPTPSRTSSTPPTGSRRTRCRSCSGSWSGRRTAHARRAAWATGPPRTRPSPPSRPRSRGRSGSRRGHRSRYGEQGFFFAKKQFKFKNIMISQMLHKYRLFYSPPKKRSKKRKNKNVHTYKAQCL